MLKEYGFSKEMEKEIVDFMMKSARLREISLRMVLKIADLAKMELQELERHCRANLHEKVQFYS